MTKSVNISYLHMIRMASLYQTTNLKSGNNTILSKVQCYVCPSPGMYISVLATCSQWPADSLNLRTWKWGLETHRDSCLKRGSMTLVNWPGSMMSRISSISPRNITSLGLLVFGQNLSKPITTCGGKEEGGERERERAHHEINLYMHWICGYIASFSLYIPYTCMSACTVYTILGMRVQLTLKWANFVVTKQGVTRKQATLY